MIPTDAFDQVLDHILHADYSPLAALCLFVAVHLAFVAYAVALITLKFGPWILAGYIGWKLLHLSASYRR